MNGPLFFGMLVALAVLIGFVALWRITPSQDPVEARLQEYGASGRQPVSADSDADAVRRRPAWPGVNRLLAGFGRGPRLATALARADLPLTAAEFALIVLGAGLVGFLIGTVRLGLGLGLALGALCGYLPILYVRFVQNRRQRAFTEQLPDVLTLLVGALRTGYGLSQALEVLVDQLPPPVSTEFARVMRAVGLGLPVQRALSDMAERVGSDDLDLVVTAINVQYEMGGNLAQTLEVIGETVRDRIRMLREIRALTAQQRLTGYILAGVPPALALMLFIIRPEYMSGLFEPGWIRLLPVAAGLLQLAGYLVIRRIVDIEV
jgi:tight adherence protein B